MEGYSYQTMKASSQVTFPEDDEVGKLVKALRWEDTFFDKEEGLVAVFDFDYEQIASFRKSVALASMLFPPIFILSTLLCAPCLYQQQINWDVYSQHVAITRDGIKFVKDRRKTGCGLSCTDAGKSSKTVPFDKLTDCDITEPAGATCCCIENVLSVVTVDTASSGGGGGGDVGPTHELSLAGLKEPLKFKQLVWAMKRAANAKGPMQSSAPLSFAPPLQSAMDRGFSNEETNAILRDIRSELIELNANFKNMDK
eukprot:scaffold15219_cov119-Skeletonema_dohrnii-CCMP3373.AAC.3